ncbi:PQQ-binding-like beta-propeller repeat protein [Patescibacteria group bacterium]|nr:PQQ-binding-like beta-propeller repeat protein [Patescibacteria group bacterium]
MKYPDLYDAIKNEALFKKDEGIKIIKSEYTGELADWVFDFRALLLQPHWLNRYAEIFWEEYGEKYPFQVCGMETAAIALVAAIVMKGVERGTPVNGFYIRKSRKRYDLMKQIEGTVTQDPVIVVDEIINTGSAVRKQLAVLDDAGVKVNDVFSILQFRAPNAYLHISERGVALNTLYTVEDFNLPLQVATAESPAHSFDVLWRFQAPSPSFHLVVQKSTPALDAKRVFFGTDAGMFYALQQDTGEIAWQFKTESQPQGKGILSSPALHNGAVYFGAYDGNVYALDADKGTIRWKYTDADWVGSSPALAPSLNLIFIGLEFALWRKRGGIVALDMQTGREVWKATHTALTHASPLYVEKEEMVVIGSNDGRLYAYNAHTGSLLWTYGTKSDILTTPSYDPKRRAIVVASMDGMLYGISAVNGKPAAVFEAGAGMYSIPLIHQDTVYVSSLDKKLYALDMDTFEPRWVYETAGRIFSSPVIADGSIWIGSNDGRLYELNPNNGTLKAFFQASERIVARIAYNEKTKQIFMHTVADELYCLKRANAAIDIQPKSY